MAQDSAGRMVFGGVWSLITESKAAMLQHKKASPSTGATQLSFPPASFKTSLSRRGDVRNALTLQSAIKHIATSQLTIPPGGVGTASQTRVGSTANSSQHMGACGREAGATCPMPLELPLRAAHPSRLRVASLLPRSTTSSLKGAVKRQHGPVNAKLLFRHHALSCTSARRGEATAGVRARHPIQPYRHARCISPPIRRLGEGKMRYRQDSLA